MDTNIDMNMDTNTPNIPIGLALKQAQHAVRLALDAVFAPLGVTMPQWGALRVAARNPGASGAEVARESFSSPQAINLIVSRLEQAGMIERRPSPEHGRVLETHLTAQGRATLDACERAYQRVEAAMLQGFSDSEKTLYAQFLARSIESLEAGGYSG